MSHSVARHASFAFVTKFLVLACVANAGPASKAVACPSPKSAGERASRADQDDRTALIVLDGKRRLLVQASVSRDGNDPIRVTVGECDKANRWRALGEAAITGEVAFGVREKTLSIVSIFAADASRDGRDDIVITYSAYIDGTGAAERYAAAIFAVKADRIDPVPSLESRFYSVRTRAQFLRRARQR
jgi:hypothetical protein